jgi:hypothetical protein
VHLKIVALRSSAGLDSESSIRVLDTTASRTTFTAVMLASVTVILTG